ncbi:MAG: hypothetical protein LUI08_04280 [Prevotella sp.]|nr:hypothetical protein [Prevotella sp.]
MKKITLLLIAAAFLCTTANADDINTSLQFAYSDGTIVPDGSEITVTSAIEAEFTGEIELPSGLYILNTTDDTCGVGMTITVSRLDNGALQYCLLGTCKSTTELLNNVSAGTGLLKAGAMDDLMTEYIPTDYGTCTATLTIGVYEAGIIGAGNYIGEGPTITVNFVYDDTSLGITDVAVADSEITGYYSVSGEKLSAPQKGVNIVKYANGQTVKTINK